MFYYPGLQELNVPFRKNKLSHENYCYLPGNSQLYCKLSIRITQRNLYLFSPVLQLLHDFQLFCNNTPQFRFLTLHSQIQLIRQKIDKKRI